MMDETGDIFVWSDSYSVGDAILDGQHQRMMSICRHLDELGSQPIESTRVLLDVLLNELAELSLEHFQTEQRILKSIGYPHWEEEAVEHEAFIADITTLINGIRDENPRINGIKGFLSGAMIDHLLHSDMRYKPYLAYSMA